MSIEDAVLSGRTYGEARADLLDLPEGEVSIDILACAGPDGKTDGNTAFMDQLTQLFAALHIEAQLRTVVLGAAMQRELTNGGIPGSSNIIYSPERGECKQTGLRLMYVNGVRGLVKCLERLRVPHAWVIGDASTYHHLAPYCRRAYIVPDGQCSGPEDAVPPTADRGCWEHERTFDRICGNGRRCSLRKYVNNSWQPLGDVPLQ